LRFAWKCELKQTRIAVSFSDEYKGYYPLLNEPYCKRCCNYGETEKTCKFHLRDKVDRTFAIGLYQKSSEDLLSKHIRQLKQWRNRCVPLGLAMALCLDEVYKIKGIDCLVPVPLHKDELKHDKNSSIEYNHAFELATIISRYSDDKLAVIDVLTKRRPEKMRSQPTYEDRWSSSKDLYQCEDHRAVARTSILLIDDVRTSGATASACAKTLLDAGAKKVSLFVAGVNKYEGPTPQL